MIALLEQNCTSCMLCVRECPDWCIELDSHKETLPGEPQPGGGQSRPRVVNVLDRFAIDFGLCMWCGICVEVCPFDALYWSPDYDHSAFEAAGLLHEKDVLGQWMSGVPGYEGERQGPP